jgi:hypothetical protein
VKNGLAFGKPASENGFPLITYQSMSFKTDPAELINTPSPRYWLLWPGVLIMLLYSFADVALSLIPIFSQMRGSFASSVIGIFRNKREVGEDDEDQTPVEDRVPTSWWTIGLLLSTIMCCAILATQFRMNVGEALLSLLLGFLFSFIGVQSSGATDVNPVSTVAKVRILFSPYQKMYSMILCDIRPLS